MHLNKCGRQEGVVSPSFSLSLPPSFSLSFLPLSPLPLPFSPPLPLSFSPPLSISPSLSLLPPSSCLLLPDCSFLSLFPAYYFLTASSCLLLPDCSFLPPVSCLLLPDCFFLSPTSYPLLPVDSGTMSCSTSLRHVRPTPCTGTSTHQTYWQLAPATSEKNLILLVSSRSPRLNVGICIYSCILFHAHQIDQCMCGCNVQVL